MHLVYYQFHVSVDVIYYMHLVYYQFHVSVDVIYNMYLVYNPFHVSVDVIYYMHLICYQFHMFFFSHFMVFLSWVHCCHRLYRLHTIFYYTNIVGHYPIRAPIHYKDVVYNKHKIPLRRQVVRRQWDFLYWKDDIFILNRGTVLVLTIISENTIGHDTSISIVTLLYTRNRCLCLLSETTFWVNTSQNTARIIIESANVLLVFRLN